MSTDTITFPTQDQITVNCYVVDQVIWDAEHKQGKTHRLTVIARKMQEVITMVRDDERAQTELIQKVGPVVLGIPELIERTGKKG